MTPSDRGKLKQEGKGVIAQLDWADKDDFIAP
jgi:hypothetical protein